MKKKDIIFWWIVVAIGLLISYKILEFNWRCQKGIIKYEDDMKQQGHKLSPLGHMMNEYQ